MRYTFERQQLCQAAERIASRRQQKPVSALTALRKLFVQERRDRKAAGDPVVGWKRGELIEWLCSRSSPERFEEWGDVGYYVAQSFRLLWQWYALLTPPECLQLAVKKFEKRAQRG